MDNDKILRWFEENGIISSDPRLNILSFDLLKFVTFLNSLPDTSRDNCTLVPTDKLKAMQEKIDWLEKDGN